MIVDSSAICAILRSEPEAEYFLRAMESNDVLRISAATYLEAAIVIDGSGSPISSSRFDQLLRNTKIVIEPVTEQQAKIARTAYQGYGKGKGHPAQLNFGDCFAYALAIDKDEPLLYKGTDFSKTDVRPYKPGDGAVN